MNAFMGSAEDVPTRIAPPKHKVWVPHRYQGRTVVFLKENARAALFLDPGLGKTSIVLEAFRQLKEEGQAERMLVIAPLRVCQLVWRQEGKKWTQFQDLTFTLLHGSKKNERLKEDTDIHLINPEGIPWLANQFMGKRQLPYDTVTIDELTRFKNHRAQRSKRLRKKLDGIRRRWGLTGSPAPNGYMDLFGQMLILDDGAALGQHITYFRDQYFIAGYNGFDWGLRGGADKRIEERIAPYVMRMAAEDYLELPPLLDNIIPIELPPDAKRHYDEMKKEMILALPEGVVTAGNAGAMYSKLSQLANGAVYLSGGKDGDYVEVHNAKIDALEDLVEELAGQPLLVAYEFQHDLDRIQARFGKDTPTLTGLSEKRITEVEAAWNRGDLPMLLVHPASAGHGLNLQEGGAGHICWFSRPFDLELYDQLIRRIFRQGTSAKRIMNHVLSVQGTMDEIKGEALEGKDTTQDRLLAALNAEILRDHPSPIAAGSAAHEEEDTMVQKLGFRNPAADAAPAAAAQEAASGSARRVQPAGWGTSPSVVDDMPPTGQEESIHEEVTGASGGKVVPRGWGAVAGSAAPSEQAEAIQGKLQAPPKKHIEEEDPGDGGSETSPLAAFGPGIVEQLTGDDASDPGEDGAVVGQSEPAPAAEPEKPKRRTRRASTPAAETSEDVKPGSIPEEAVAAAAEQAQDGRFSSALAERRFNDSKAQPGNAGMLGQKTDAGKRETIDQYAQRTAGGYAGSNAVTFNVNIHVSFPPAVLQLFATLAASLNNPHE